MEDFLRSPSPLTQTNAALAIRKMGTNAVPFLVHMLSAKDSKFKMKCLDLLGRQHWINVHVHYDFQERSDALRCLRVLGPIGNAAIPQVANLLDQPSDSEMAAYTLYCIGSNALPALTDALTNRNERARSDATAMLGRLQEPQSVSNLVAMLKDPDFITRSTAAHALSRFPDQADVIVPALMDCLDHPDRTFRGNAARALAKFGTAAKPAIPKLLRMVQSTDSHESETAAGVLTKLDFEGTLAAFTNNLESADVNVRRTTAWALMLFKSSGEPAVPALVKCLKDPDTQVRQNAAVALREIGEDADLVVPALMANLNDPDLKLRSITAIALCSFGERAKPAVPAILKLIEENKGNELTISGLYNALVEIDPDAAAKLTGK